MVDFYMAFSKSFSIIFLISLSYPDITSSIPFNKHFLFNYSIFSLHTPVLYSFPFKSPTRGPLLVLNLKTYNNTNLAIAHWKKNVKRVFWGVRYFTQNNYFQYLSNLCISSFHSPDSMHALHLPVPFIS